MPSAKAGVLAVGAGVRAGGAGVLTRGVRVPAVDAVAWFGVQVPARTPRPVVQRLATEVQAAVRDPAVRAKIEEQGAEPVGDAPEQFEAYIKREIARWGEVVKANNIRADS